MKRSKKLFALLLALACCLALLTVSAMAEDTFTYVKGLGKDLEIPLEKGYTNYLSYSRLSIMVLRQMETGNVYYLHNAGEFAIENTRIKNYLILFSSFLENIPDGKYVTDVDLSRDSTIPTLTLFVESAGGDFPPATPTDLGGSDEPDEVLYPGGMSGAGVNTVKGGAAAKGALTDGVAETKGGKPAERETGAALPAAKTQQAAILPENASAANPATGAAL